MNITGKRFWWFLISGIILLVGIIFMAAFGFKTGIEFSSGSLLTVSFQQEIDFSQLKQEVVSLGYTNAIIQQTGQGQYLIRTEELTDAAKAQLEQALSQKFGQITEAEFSSVSPLVASETARNAVIAVAISAVGMLLYIIWAFRKLPNAIRYGTGAIIGLLHDVLVSAGIFAILAVFFNWEIDLMFITAVLAILGYSINNTVVVFDRIRENVKLGISADFETVVNNSLVETLGRCLNTTLTTIITILALLLFVGSSIQNFVVVFLVGNVVGTFGSICVVPNLLVVWEKKEWGRFIPFRHA